MTKPDVFERVALLFCRLLQRDSTERPRFMVAPLPGAAWGAVVYLGDPPDPFKEHYARRQVLARVEAVPEPQGLSYRAAVAPSAGQALGELERVLTEGLRARVAGDLAVWDQATGEPWPGVAPVLRIEARSDEPDPADAKGGARQLPARR